MVRIFIQPERLKEQEEGLLLVSLLKVSLKEQKYYPTEKESLQTHFMNTAGIL